MENKTYTFWKHPWQKWVILLCMLLQLWALWLNVQDYRLIERMDLVSEELLAQELSAAAFTCALNGMLAALFAGVFLMGQLVRSKRQQYLAECILLFAGAALWIAAGVLMHCIALTLRGAVWGVLLLALLVGAAYDLWKLRQERGEQKKSE